ncbi:unnamed protein product [Oikopleura dioica]|uniref:Uncharacterized protein n=1 Tax=Oikopleura dioica TaxID=34765 RepID=E4YGR3_OIKDI|nr:unnamed protein product [Oikopleura dioica]
MESVTLCEDVDYTDVNNSCTECGEMPEHLIGHLREWHWTSFAYKNDICEKRHCEPCFDEQVALKSRCEECNVGCFSEDTSFTSILDPTFEARSLRGLLNKRIISMREENAIIQSMNTKLMEKISKLEEENRRIIEIHNSTKLINENLKSETNKLEREKNDAIIKIQQESQKSAIKDKEKLRRKDAEILTLKAANQNYKTKLENVEVENKDLIKLMMEIQTEFDSLSKKFSKITNDKLMKTL